MTNQGSNKAVKCVVTGATGMVGAHVVAQLLQDGYAVTVLVRNPVRLENLWQTLALLGVAESRERVSVMICDLLNPIELYEALAGCMRLFHCAGSVSFSERREQEVIETNTQMTLHVVNAAMRQGVSILVHMSSIAALGAEEYPLITTEGKFPKSIAGWSGYALSKFYSENQVWYGIKTGLNAVILNPSVILGIGDWSGDGSPGLFRRVARGMPFYTNGVTGYVDVRDVALAAVRLSEQPQAWGRRYLVSAANLSYRELFTQVAAATNSRAPRWGVGRKLLGALGGLSRVFAFVSRREPLLSRALLRTATTRHLYYSDLLRETTGLEYRSMAETIQFIGAQYLKSRTKA